MMYAIASILNNTYSSVMIPPQNEVINSFEFLKTKLYIEGKNLTVHSETEIEYSDKGVRVQYRIIELNVSNVNYEKLKNEIDNIRPL